MSMSGRLSTDQNPAWAYGALPQYNSDGSTTPGHGRRSSIYRAQNSTLFNAFEEGDNVPLTDLPEEESDEDEDGERRKSSISGGARGVGGGTGMGTGAGVGRSLVGGGRAREEEGGRYPGYA